MTDETTKKLAEEHWDFLEPRYKMMFIDGWIHGAKHEREHSKDKLVVLADTNIQKRDKEL